jgi:hypothetical protein
LDLLLSHKGKKEKAVVVEKLVSPSPRFFNGDVFVSACLIYSKKNLFPKNA